MDRYAVAAALAPALLLYACDRAVMPAPKAEPTEPVWRATTAAAPQSSSSSVSAAANGEDGVNDGYPDLTPPLLSREAERGAKGARNVLISFASAIELKEFDQAWALLGSRDKQRWSKPAFAQMFADLGNTMVAIPSGTLEGTAGSASYTAPITITANDDIGRPVRIEGEAVLRRIHDDDGPVPDLLRWHFERLTLDWTH